MEEPTGRMATYKESVIGRNSKKGVSSDSLWLDGETSNDDVIDE